MCISDYKLRVKNDPTEAFSGINKFTGFPSDEDIVVTLKSGTVVETWVLVGGCLR